MAINQDKPRPSMDQKKQKTALNSHSRQRQRIQARRQSEMNTKPRSNQRNTTPLNEDLKSQRQIDKQKNRTSQKPTELKKRKTTSTAGTAQKKRSQQPSHPKQDSNKTNKQKLIFGLKLTGDLKKDWKCFNKQERRKFVLFSILALFLAMVLLFCLVELVTTPALDMEKIALTSGTQILDKNGEYYQSFETKEYRELISLDQVPDYVQNAFVDIEDQRYYSHHGVDLKGLIRAILGVFGSGSLEGPGGSTITQQLIKQTHLSSEKTLSRKFHEIVLALQLEKEIDKKTILEAYLNKINFAQTWGIQAAAKTYFAKDVSQLTLAQGAILASMPKSPMYYEPICWDENGNVIKTEDGRCALNDASIERACIILNKMLELGHISSEQCEEAKNQVKENKIDLTFNPQLTVYSSFTDALYEILLQDLQKKLGMTEEEAILYLQNEGVKVYSTIDQEVQKAMEEAANDDSNFPGQSGVAAEASAILSAESGEEVNLIPQVGMTVIDNQTGGVAGMVGARGEKGNLTLNRATAHFQPGSSTKPLTTYGPGLDSKAITLGTVFTDTDVSIGDWNPQNDGGGHSGNVTIRHGLTQSLNTIAVQACMKTGVETCAGYGNKLGLTIDPKEDINVAALALGGYVNGQCTLDMASAYSTFPNKGIHKSYYFYTKVVDRNGKVILENKPTETRVFTEETTYLITDVLQQAIKGGTTTIYCDQPIAGKTGTTDEQRHAWICGYTPYYSMAIWMGYDRNYIETKQGEFVLNIGINGGNFPGPAAIFSYVMNTINNNKPEAAFMERPASIISVGIDTTSGMLASDLSSKAGHSTSELFIEGTEPSQVDDTHYTAKICKTTGLLANDYCTDTEEKVFYHAKDLFPDGVSGYPVAMEAPTETCSTHTAKTKLDALKKKKSTTTTDLSDIKNGINSLLTNH